MATQPRSAMNCLLVVLDHVWFGFTRGSDLWKGRGVETTYTIR